MRRIIATLAPIAALGLLAAPAIAQDDDADMTRGEKQLARMLEGREAGEAERCVRTFPSARITIIDGEGIIVRTGNRVYFNRTTNPETLDDDDILVIRRYSGDSRLCERETLETYSRGGNFFTGIVSLEEFVPYERVENDNG
jgi:hypothetical protein